MRFRSGRRDPSKELYRIVAIEDVYRFAELLKERIPARNSGIRGGNNSNLDDW